LLIESCHDPNGRAHVLSWPEDKPFFPAGAGRMKKLRIPVRNPMFLSERRKKLKHFLNWTSEPDRAVEPD
jgi:hypothetical protein